MARSKSSQLVRLSCQPLRPSQHRLSRCRRFWRPCSRLQGAPDVRRPQPGARRVVVCRSRAWSGRSAQLADTFSKARALSKLHSEWSTGPWSESAWPRPTPGMLGRPPVPRRSSWAGGSSRSGGCLPRRLHDLRIEEEALCRAVRGQLSVRDAPLAAQASLRDHVRLLQAFGADGVAIWVPRLELGLPHAAQAA